MLVRICIFFLGLLCIANGVAITSKALLGTSPIASIPYSLSLVFPSLSFGCWVILFNLFLVLLEWFLLRGKIRFLLIVIQSLLACTFGYFVDLSLFMLAGIDPHTYAEQILWVAAGSIVLALGVFLTLRSKVAVLPGDGFALAVSNILAKDFGRVRLAGDVVMTLCAVFICWIALDGIAGVREGTVLASLLTSPVVRLLMRLGQKHSSDN